jgi:hypothetical protein
MAERAVKEEAMNYQTQLAELAARIQEAEVRLRKELELFALEYGQDVMDACYKFSETHFIDIRTVMQHYRNVTSIVKPKREYAEELQALASKIQIVTDVKIRENRDNIPSPKGYKLNRWSK